MYLMRCHRLLITLFLMLVGCVHVHADEMRPGLLEIKERHNGWFDVVWKLPITADGQLLDVALKLPDSLELLGKPTIQKIPAAIVERATYKAGDTSLAGQTVSVEGLKYTTTDILLRIQLQNGTVHSTVLRPIASEYKIPELASKMDVVSAYWQMGVIHILEGLDHILFVFAMLLIVVGFGALVKAITAFTIAHSITLVLASLDYLALPAAPTEAIISLSIVFLAAEIIHKYQGKRGLTERYPWMVAFLFGLFHGLGFAGALAEIGLPQHEVPLALLMFNVGVETGQLLFVSGILASVAMLKRLSITRSVVTSEYLPPGLAYGIGGLAAFWTIDRVALAFI